MSSPSSVITTAAKSPDPPAQITIRRLKLPDTADYRTIRLSALLTSPEAFGSTYAETISQGPNWFSDGITNSIIHGAYASSPTPNTPPTIIGMIGLRRATNTKDAHKGLVVGFFVEPACRRRGVGRALVSEVVRSAEEVEGVEQLHLSVVTENVAALRLYESCGFVGWGVEPRALKWEGRYFDEVKMVRILDRAA